jgi:leucyl aminopeptidase
MAGDPDPTPDLAAGVAAPGLLRVHAATAEEFAGWLAGKPSPLDAPLVEQARRIAGFARFAAKQGQSLALAAGDANALVVGRAPGAGTRSLRSAAAAAAQAVRAGARFAFVLPAEPDPAHRVAALAAPAEGVALSSYRCKRSGAPLPAEAAGPCTLVAADATPAECDSALRDARAHVAGIVLARDLTNAPAAEVGPDQLADAALELARRHGFAAECWRGAELEERGFRMVAAVGRASAHPPTVTVVSHGLAAAGSAAGGVAPAVALIGKGVVFDSGGLDLKPADAMLLMRKDMAGAATVLGALESAARLGVDLPWLAVIPSAENMVGPDAYRPGDVLRSYSGTTVEIGNTDAEGRLLLADALGFARERGARRLVDYATLTGAARVALGRDLPALFCNDEAWAAAVGRCAAASDEPVWRMPLHDDYDRQLDTPFADVNHVSHDKFAGAITAALFLRRFVAATPWAHVDFYGWEDAGRPETPKGATGAGVRTLTRLLRELARGAD